MDWKKLSKRVMNIPLRYVLLFTLINTIFLFYYGHIVTRVGLFLVCVVVLYFFGRLPFADVDPVPFTSAINYLFFGLPVALQYAIWVCPAADAMTGNFNQWTFVTLVSILASLFITSLFGFSPYYFLLVMILLYNLIRLILTSVLGSLSGAIISTTTNALLYFIISGLVLPVIEFGISVFR
jgi:hypothetical protein